MGLMPDELWSLTPREFWLKYDAFIRAEDRAEAAMVRQALRLGSFSKTTAAALRRHANTLKRYPIKPWLK